MSCLDNDPGGRYLGQFTWRIGTRVQYRCVLQRHPPISSQTGNTRAENPFYLFRFSSALYASGAQDA